MEIILARFALLSLIISLFFQIKNYRYRIFLHPSFWFLMIWIMSVLSFLLYIFAGLNYILFDSKKLVELFSYISFTAIFICIFGFIGSKKTNDRVVSWSPIIDERFYLFLSRIMLVIGIVSFIINGSFDLVANRDASQEDVFAIANSGGALPVYRILFNLIIGLNTPLLILAGYYIGLYMIDKNNRVLKFDYFYPIIVSVIQTLQIGGRGGIVTTFVVFSPGLFIALFSDKGKYYFVFKKILTYALVIFFCFSLYSNYINAIREGHSYEHSQSIERWNKYPSLKPFSGLLQYMTDHYPGYQLRRMESDRDNPLGNLEWGQNSFACFFSYNIPIFTQVIGVPISLQSMFNLKSVKPVEVKVSFEDKEWEQTTCTVFYPMYLDFGYYGVYLVTLLFIIFSQYLFNQLFYTQRQSMLYILPFYLVYKLWSLTIFSHHLKGNWLAGIVYTFLIFDLLVYFYNRKMDA